MCAMAGRNGRGETELEEEDKGDGGSRLPVREKGVSGWASLGRCWAEIGSRWLRAEEEKKERRWALLVWV